MIRERKDTDQVIHLLKDWDETIIWSCLQQIMGHIYTEDSENPVSVMAELGDFCFFAGEPSEALVRYRSEYCNPEFIIMVPQNDAWAQMIERCYSENAKKVTRYAIKKEKDNFDIEALETLANTLPENYELKMMDERLFHICEESDWCKDFVAQYDSYETYQTYGMGVLALKDGEPIAGASSYSSYLAPCGIRSSDNFMCQFSGGIEIEIDTKEEYRRQGLATACGAKLIRECLKKGWYPSWDAQNLWSVALAEKLGYHFSHDYVAYEVYDR